MQSCVCKVPELRSLILRVPAVIAIPERKTSFLRAGFFFIAPCAADRSIVFAFRHRLLETFRLHDIGVELAPVRKRIDAFCDTLFVDVHEYVNSKLPSHLLLAKSDHLAEFERGIDMQKGEGDLCRMKRFLREPQ